MTRPCIRPIAPSSSSCRANRTSRGSLAARSIPTPCTWPARLCVPRSDTSAGTTLAELYEQTVPARPYSPDPESAGRRALRSAALDLLVATGEALGDRARRAALPRGRQHDRRHRRAIDPLSCARDRRATRRSSISMRAGRTSRWCSTNGSRCRRGRPGPIRSRRCRRSSPTRNSRSRTRTASARCSAASPSANATGFNRADGAGYRLLAAQALEIDRFNPHVAARLLGAFESWRILEPGRQARAKAVLEDLAAKSLSTDSYEIVTKTLGRGLESRLVNGLLTEFPQLSSGQPTPSSIPMTIRAIRRCGTSPARCRRTLEGNRMARARSARGGFAFAGPQWQDLRAIVSRHLPNDERLRRLVPMLLAGFVAIAFIGFAAQLINGKSAALDAARQQLSLIADNTSLGLKDQDTQLERRLAERAGGEPAQRRDRRQPGHPARRRRGSNPRPGAVRWLAARQSPHHLGPTAAAHHVRRPRPACCA